MKYCAMNAEQLIEFYGRYARIDEKTNELIVPRGGQNHGENGAPNLSFRFEFIGALTNKQNRLIDVTKGLHVERLAKDFYAGFDGETVVIPGSKLRSNKHAKRYKNFYVTFDLSKVAFVMIGHRRNHDIDQYIQELVELAEFSCLGEMYEGENCCWDYFVLPITADYNEVADRNDVFLTDAKYAGCKKQDGRRQMLRETLEAQFGNIDELVKMESMTRSVKTSILEKFCQWQYKDALYHEWAWVICSDGRLLKPTRNSARKTGPFFQSIEVSYDDAWEKIPEDCLIIYYKRQGVSSPAEYDFVYKPQEITLPQRDRLVVIEHDLREEVTELVKNYPNLQYAARLEVTSNWTQQLHDASLTKKK